VADTITQQETVQSVEIAVFGAGSPLLGVSECESGFIQYRNQSPLESTTGDLGAMQISRIHEKEAKTHGWDISTLSGNLLYAKYLYEKDGLKPWLSSRHCWAKLADSS